LGITLFPIFLSALRKTGKRVGLSALALFLPYTKEEKGAQTIATIPYANRLDRGFIRKFKAIFTTYLLDKFN